MNVMRNSKWFPAFISDTYFHYSRNTPFNLKSGLFDMVEFILNEADDKLIHVEYI